MECLFLDLCKDERKRNVFYLTTVMAEYEMDTFVYAQGVYAAVGSGNLRVIQQICMAVQIDSTIITEPTFFKTSWAPHDENVFEACILDRAAALKRIDIYAWFDVFYKLALPPLAEYTPKLALAPAPKAHAATPKCK